MVKNLIKRTDRDYSAVGRHTLAFYWPIELVSSSDFVVGILFF
jgi:hypothetical protein